LAPQHCVQVVVSSQQVPFGRHVCAGGQVPPQQRKPEPAPPQSAPSGWLIQTPPLHAMHSGQPHVPPQLSGSPLHLPAHCLVQPQTPCVPPPPHVSWPVHAEHAVPFVPHCWSVWSANFTHVSPLQQPLGQLVASQTHAPPRHCCPSPQVWHVPL
jgi:hypothetical protein